MYNVEKNQTLKNLHCLLGSFTMAATFYRQKGLENRIYGFLPPTFETVYFV